MTQLAPYYFDNELVSANARRIGEDDYELEVNVNDDELKAAVAEHLDVLEEEVDRWHVAAEKATDTVEAAEGVEAPTTESRP